MRNKFKVRFKLKDNGNNTQNLYVISYQNSVQISETNFGNIVDILNYKKENTNLKQALNEIREIVKNFCDNLDDIMCYDIDKYKKSNI